MNMKKLTTLLLTATLGLASGAVLAADTGAQSNNGRQLFRGCRSGGAGCP